jgi:hypothetical protein
MYWRLTVVLYYLAASECPREFPQQCKIANFCCTLDAVGCCASEFVVQSNPGHIMLTQTRQKIIVAFLGELCPESQFVFEADLYHPAHEAVMPMGDA